MKRLFKGLFVSALSLVVTNTQAQVEFTFQEGINGFTGTADTHFFTGDPIRVAGNSLEFEWDGSDAGGFNVGALRFDNIIGDAPNQIPAGSTVVRAFLTLVVTDSGSSGQIATVHELLKPFEEDFDLIAFTPNFEPTAGDDFKEEVIAEIPGPTAGDILEVDVTPSLQLWVGGEENLGWLFFPDLNGTNGVGVQSSDAAEAEISVLIIETDAGTFEFREGENGYTGLQDAWIGNQNARFSTNFGTGPTMDLELDSPEDVEFVLLRFDNIIGSEANQVPPNTQIN